MLLRSSRMADFTSATALNLDASELRRLTKWPDPVIEEFLSLQGSISNAINNINIVINNINSVQGDVNLSLAKNSALARSLGNLTQQNAALASLISAAAATGRDVSKIVAGMAQSNAALLSRNNALQAKLNVMKDQMASMRQEMAGLL